ncbi:MAG TPA: TetR/AcrR family transcriptional regulator [Cellulomonas sp.]
MPKIIDHEARRASVIAAARRLIIAGGLEAATMRAIAAEVGNANGALKHYFASKEAIVSGVFEAVLAEVTSQTEAVTTGEDPVDRLRAYVATSLPLTPQSIREARVLLAMWELSLSDEGLARRYEQHLSSWRATLARYFADVEGCGRLAPGVDVPVVLDEVIATVVGASTVSLMTPPGSMIARYRGVLDHWLATWTVPAPDATGTRGGR